MRVLAALLILATGCSRAEAGEPTCKRRPLGVVGVNVVDLPDEWAAESERGARGYGSARARRQLDRLAALGIDHVALPVTVWARSTSSTSVDGGPLLDARGRARLAKMVDDAHQRKMSVAIVPHLQFRDGGWRGQLPTASAAALLESYSKALVPVVELAERHCAELYAVGIEFRSVSTDPAHDDDFKALVKSARRSFTGTLGYSANWDELERVRHFGLLDVVGVNAFFPLATEASASDAELRAGAERAHQAMAAVAAREKKPLVIFELGFQARRGAFVQPWLWPKEVDAVLDLETQRRAYDASRQGLSRSQPRTVAFWMVTSDPDDMKNRARFETRSGFSFLDKPAEGVVRAIVKQVKSKP